MKTSQVLTCCRQQTLSHTNELADNEDTPRDHLLQALSRSREYPEQQTMQTLTWYSPGTHLLQTADIASHERVTDNADTPRAHLLQTLSPNERVTDNADTPHAHLLKTLSPDEQEADNADTPRAHLLQTLSPDERVTDNADRPGNHLLQTADIVSHECIGRQYRHVKCSSGGDSRHCLT